MAGGGGGGGARGCLASRCRRRTVRGAGPRRAGRASFSRRRAARFCAGCRRREDSSRYSSKRVLVSSAVAGPSK